MNNSSGLGVSFYGASTNLYGWGILTLRHAFPSVSQKLFPNERLDAIRGQYFHFTQLPHLKINYQSGLFKGYHITILFDMGFRTMTRSDLRNTCMRGFTRWKLPLHILLQSLGHWLKLNHQKLGRFHQNPPQEATSGWTLHLTEVPVLFL